MMRTLSTWLILALVGGALVAGCGSSASTPTRTRTIPATTTTAPTATKATTTGRASGTTGITGKPTSSSQTTPTAAKTTSTGTATGGGTATGQRITQQIKNIVKKCRQIILAERSLPAAQRTAIEKLCKKIH